jgi:hypothetical protein
MLRKTLVTLVSIAALGLGSAAMAAHGGGGGGGGGGGHGGGAGFGCGGGFGGGGFGRGGGFGGAGVAATPRGSRRVSRQQQCGKPRIRGWVTRTLFACLER